MLGLLHRHRFFTLRETYFFSPFRDFTFLTIIFYGLLAAAMLAPLGTIDSIPNVRDYYSHTVSIIQAKMAMSAGQFPLRTMPLEYSGWLYPFYQFYSPTSYTITALIYKWLTPANPFFALKLMLWIALTLGGFNMFVLANWFVKSKPAALLAGVIYLTSPYYLIIVTHLGSFNEVIALGILPAIIYFSLQRFYFPQNNATLMVLAILWYLLITVHMVTFVYLSFFLSILFFLVAVKNPRHWRNIISVASAFLFGILLAMWFIAPALWLQKYLVVSTTYTTYVYIGMVHPLLSHLLFSGAGFFPSVKDSLLALRPSLGLPMVFSGALCCYAYFKKLSCGCRRGDYWLPYLLIIFFIAFFLVWSPINIWKFVPEPLLVGQYCWRLLSQVIWIGALLAAWTICWLFKNKMDVRHIVIGSLLLVLSTAAWDKVSQYGVQPLAPILKNPVLPYNHSAYKIHFVRYPQFVSAIDSSLITSEELLTDFNYTIEKPLFRFAKNPTLVVQSEDNKTRDLILSASMNNQVIASKELSAGKLNWSIDLSSLKNTYPDASPLQLKFYLRDKNNNLVKEPLPVDKVFLSGFIEPSTILRVQQVQPYCVSKNSIWTCDIFVPNGVNLVALPALYYPKLLNVKIDEVESAYKGIMSEGSLLAGVSPTPGKKHKIQIEFRGLTWANKVSDAAWLMLLLLFSCKFLKNIIKLKSIK